MTITIVKMVWHSTCKPYSCDKLAQRNYNWRHDNVAGTVPYKLCGKFGLDRIEKWYVCDLKLSQKKNW